MMDMELQITSDGSPTLYRPDIDEHYHSVCGALAESRYVYIETGLLYRAARCNRGTVLKVFEVGFGTGLDVVLAALTGLNVHYTSVEKYPLQPETVAKLDFGPQVPRALLAEIHNAPWNEDIRISDAFVVRKMEADLLTCRLPEGTFDVIFMDAFAPEKQPELWTDEILGRLARMLAPGGVLTTYCAKGRVRRALQASGLKVERLPGPPGGKREILRATRLESKGDFAVN